MIKVLGTFTNRESVVKALWPNSEIAALLDRKNLEQKAFRDWQEFADREIHVEKFKPVFEEMEKEFAKRAQRRDFAINEVARITKDIKTAFAKNSNGGIPDEKSKETFINGLFESTKSVVEEVTGTGSTDAECPTTSNELAAGGGGSSTIGHFIGPYAKFKEAGLKRELLTKLLNEAENIIRESKILTKLLNHKANSSNSEFNSIVLEINDLERNSTLGGKNFFSDLLTSARKNYVEGYPEAINKITSALDATDAVSIQKLVWFSDLNLTAAHSLQVCLSHRFCMFLGVTAFLKVWPVFWVNLDIFRNFLKTIHANLQKKIQVSGWTTLQYRLIKSPVDVVVKYTGAVTGITVLGWYGGLKPFFRIANFMPRAAASIMSSGTNAVVTTVNILGPGFSKILAEFVKFTPRLDGESSRKAAQAVLDEALKKRK